jgi:hypothetical protein
MAAADHEHAFAGVARALRAQHVRHAIGDAVGERALAECGYPARAHRVGGIDGAGSVDHRLREHGVLAVGVLVLDQERHVAAMRVLHPVVALAGHGTHARAEAQARRDLRQRGQRLQVTFHHLAAGRERGRVRRGPAVRVQQRARGAVDVEFPRREHPYVRPAPHAGADAVAGLQHQRRQAAFEQVGGGGKAHGAGTDDNDGQLGVHGGCLRRVPRRRREWGRIRCRPGSAGSGVRR